MPDYIYLLENRLSADQQNAVRQLREAAREAGMLLFLTGDAVRDLTSGHAVRDLEVAVHGNPIKLKKQIAKLGGNVWGEDEASHSLYLCFPGTVRVDVIGAHSVEYSKPGSPVYHPASIQEDLRRRDFTVNAMAISLNEGSFGLLMDPMNGAADIEARTLRLVSNYGFLEEPSLMVRATRYRARLGWELDPKTQTRYENAKSEGVIEYLSAKARSQELEQIGHEDDGLKVLQTLDTEGWMKVLFPAWTPAKADEEKLTALHSLAVELMLQGVHPDMSAAQMQLLTARLSSKEVSALKQLMLRPGFVEEWNSLDSLAAGFAKVLLSKENSIPSAGYKLFTSYDPEAILWLGFTSKTAAVQERFRLFLKEWPEARQRIPHALMQEMRITPELAGYAEIVHSIFLQLIDGKLSTPEELRAFLEPHSPPAPPPQVTIKRPRVKRGSEAKLKEHSYDDDEEAEDSLDEDEDLDDIGGDDDEIDLGLSIPKIALEEDLVDEADAEEEEEKPAVTELAPAKRVKAPAQAKPMKESVAPVSVKTAKQDASVASAKPVAEKAARIPLATKPKAEQKQVKPVPAAMPAQAVAKADASSSKAKPIQASAAKKAQPAPAPAKSNKAAKPAAGKDPGKAAAKAPAKVQSKTPAKVVAKTPAKTQVVKPKAAKTKPAPAVISKAGKGSKPAGQAEKKHDHKGDNKHAHKAGKKR